MDGGEGDNSSEGIVASSDDEFDGLSQAVEHHICKRETFRRESKDTDWRSIGQPPDGSRRQYSYEDIGKRKPFDPPPYYHSTSGSPPRPRRHFRSPPRDSLPGGYQHHSDYDYRPGEMHVRRSPPPMWYPSHSSPPQTHAKFMYGPSFERGVPQPGFEEMCLIKRDPLPIRPRLPPNVGRPNAARSLNLTRPRERYTPDPQFIAKPLKSCLRNPSQATEPCSTDRPRSSRSPSPSRRARCSHSPNLGRRHSPVSQRFRHGHLSNVPPIHVQSPSLSPDRLRHSHSPTPPGSKRSRFSRSPLPDVHHEYHFSRYQDLDRERNPPRVFSPKREPLNRRNRQHQIESQYSVKSGVPPRHADPRLFPNPRNFPKNNDDRTAKHREKSPPKPVSFKIKSVPPRSLKKSHPLDPLSDSNMLRGSSSSSPRRWSHDKYEEPAAEEVEGPKDRTQNSPRKKRTRSVTEHQSLKNLGSTESYRENGKRPRIHATSHVNDEKNAESAGPDSPEVVLIHTEREQETVYEEEEIVLDGDCEKNSLESASAEEIPLLGSDDDDDDEELLGLRLQALTSALNMENRAKKVKGTVLKKKSDLKKRKPKHLLRRVPESPKRMTRKCRSNRNSEFADNFLKKYNSISKYRSPERPRIVPGKPSPTQLTLFGEIIRNHQPTSKTETLRYIRSLPDDGKTTAMFLNVVKHNRIEESEAINLFRQTVVRRKEGTPQKEEKTAHPPNDNVEKPEQVEDNYEEIEMDLEGEGSDSDLVPPGTDTTPIDPPLSPSKPSDSPYTPTRGTDTLISSETDSTKGGGYSAVLATPTQESIWSMLEKPVEKIAKTDANEHKITDIVEKDEAARQDRERIPSDELDIDDDALLLLRTKLLQQIDKSGKNGEKPVKSTGTEADGPLKKDVSSPSEESAPLTSQFPYQPPTLQIGEPANHGPSKESVPIVNAKSPFTSVASPTTLLPSVVHSVPGTIALCATSNLATLSAVQTQPFPPLIPNVLIPVSKPNDIPVASDLPSVSAPSTSVMISNSPLGVLEEMKAALELSNVNLTTHAFKPQMSSTPANTPIPTPIPMRQQTKRGRNRNKRKARQQKAASKVPPKQPSSEKQVKNGVVNPASVIVSAVPKVQVSISKAAKQVLPVASQTIVKTATTIIKTNAIIAKRQEKNSSPTNFKSNSGVPSKRNPDKALPILLPRHQPVVINLNESSDEEDSFLTLSKGRAVAKNPQELHRDMLNAMIRQVREQTTEKQRVEMVSRDKQQDRGKFTNQDAHKKVESWPFSKQAVLPVKRLSPVPNLAKKGTIGAISGKEQNENLKHALERNCEQVFSETNKPVHSKISPTVHKSDSRQLDQKAVSKNGQLSDSSEQLKQSRSKFLKLKVLIKKDEISQKQLAKVKEDKKAELKMVEDELKEMFHRVAAIKGKKSRCEERLKRYNQQEAKIKERMGKRNALKCKLEERIKQQWLKARAEKRAKKSEMPVAVEMRRATPIQKAVISDLKPSSPANVKKQERLDEEKHRLRAVEKELAKKISEMKNSDAASASKATKSHRRSSLSKEVRSHLAVYQKTRKSTNPSSHDLSLSKIAISALSPVRSTPKKNEMSAKENISPAKKFLEMPSKNEEDSPKKQKENQKQTTTVTSDAQSNRDSVSKDKLKSSFSGEVTQKLRKILEDSMKNMKPLLSAANQPFADVPFSSKAWEIPSPEGFRKWRVDVSETPTNTVQSDADRKSYWFQPYTSPLRMFRSYRLSPFFRVKEKLPMTSKTFSHKINPRKILCRYDLTGTCQDRDCRAQHAKQYQLTASEQLLDLLSHCPRFLETEGSYENLIKSAEAKCNKLCGIAITRVHMSLDEKSIMIASKVNDGLGNKPPYTTVFKPRLVKPEQIGDNLWTFSTNQDDIEMNHNKESSRKQDAFPEHPDSSVGDEERYFSERDAGHLAKLEQEVKKNPHNVQLWLELANQKMQKISSKEQNRLELALHTMCLALEENPYVGELWASYLSLLHRRKGEQSDEDLDEMVSQAIELVPLSTHVWNQLLSWECNSVKREFLYDQLIANLIKNVEGESDTSGFPSEVSSRWLLQTVLQRAQLQLYRNTFPIVLSSLQITVKDFSQQCRRASSSQASERCLTFNDLSSLWIAFINLSYFKALPHCFFPNPGSNVNLRQCLGVRVRPDVEVHLEIDSKTKLNEALYKKIHSDLNVAIKECGSPSGNTNIPCFVLLRERLCLERAQQQWESAIVTCRLLCEGLWDSVSNWEDMTGLAESVRKQLLTETTISWADSLVKNGDCLEATQVFDNTIMKQPSNARLCYEAALFQLNLESVDVEAALLYFEAFVSAYLDTGKDSLNKTELTTMLRHLLRLPLPTSVQQPMFVNGVTFENVKEERTYLWLIYCILLGMSGVSEEEIIESYEKAMDGVEKEGDRKEIWLRYLRYMQLLGPCIAGSGVELSKARQSWLKRFTSVVRRCLLTMSPRISGDDILAPDNPFFDYTFHNQVCSIYLSCFYLKQQMTTAYNFLTELMPYNVPLLLRASRYFLSFGDHLTVISILWKVTSNALCQNKTLWKISVASHFSIGRIAKAIRLSKQAVEAIPYSPELWSDYLTLLKAFGKPDDFIAEKIRCSSCLQMDVTHLLPAS